MKRNLSNNRYKMLFDLSVRIGIIFIGVIIIFILISFYLTSKGKVLIFMAFLPIIYIFKELFIILKNLNNYLLEYELEENKIVIYFKDTIKDQIYVNSINKYYKKNKNNILYICIDASNCKYVFQFKDELNKFLEDKCIEKLEK